MRWKQDLGVFSEEQGRSEQERERLGGGSKDREKEKRQQDATARLKTQRKFHLDAETQSFLGGEKTVLFLPLYSICGRAKSTELKGSNDEKECPVQLRSVTHQTCLVLWTWRKLADETNVKNAHKICWKIVPTWGIQTALAIHITQSQDYPYAKNEYKLVVVIYCTRMTILMREMNANV